MAQLWECTRLLGKLGLLGVLGWVLCRAYLGPHDNVVLADWGHARNLVISDLDAERRAAIAWLLAGDPADVDRLVEETTRAEGKPLEGYLAALECLIQRGENPLRIPAMRGLRRLCDDPRPEVRAAARISRLRTAQVRGEWALTQLEQRGAILGSLVQSDFRPVVAVPREIAYLLLGETWRGSEDDLWLLEELPPLRYLYVQRGLEISPETRQNLTSAQPWLRIFEVGRGCLGVTGRNFEGGFRILGADDTSPAAQGGLRTGDILTALNGVPITTFDEMLTWLAEREPGEAIVATVQRESAMEDVTVVLGYHTPDGCRCHPESSSHLDLLLPAEFQP